MRGTAAAAAGSFWRSLPVHCALFLGLFCAVSRGSLELGDLFAYGPAAGDEALSPGSDSTAELALNGSVFFFSETFDKVYINTNGFVSFVIPPFQEEYLGGMPSDFKMILALMGDLDNTDGQGAVYFRRESSPDVLERAGRHIQQAFPRDQGVAPTEVFIVTWDKMAADNKGTSGSDVKRNTFQLVVASMEFSSCAILLFPKSGLQYFSTVIENEVKPLETGFNEGEVGGWFWGKTQGTYFKSTNEEEENSISQLTENTNSGQNGVWVYEIGTSPFFTAITPGMVAREAAEYDEVTDDDVTDDVIGPDDDVKDDVTVPKLTTNNQGGQQEVVFPTFEAQTTEEPFYDYETVTPYYSYNYPEQGEPKQPETPAPRHPEPSEPRYPDQTEPRYSPNPPQIVVVDEDEDLNVDVFAYNLETCAHNKHKCSPFSDCRDYRTGYCCHCKPGFYGNGRDCVAEGKPQRMNGKVSGRVFVGSSPLPVELANLDLHSYVVANDGRAYVAVSNVPDSVGPSLTPLSSVGGVIGWAFALEQPGYQNGFSLIGGVFSRQAEVVFHPGNERLSIKQFFKGIDEHEHLVVSTELDGRVPAIQIGATVHIQPYKEIYQYDTNLITSSCNRDYTVTSPDGVVQTRSYQWRQTISFEACSHGDTHTNNNNNNQGGGYDVIRGRHTQQLSVEQIFVMFDASNHLIRYAMSNSIGSVHGGAPQQNPCFTGRHGCDINAVCRAGEHLQFSCECSSGFHGDGRTCDDIDECRDPGVCGPNSVCNNQPGTFRCECVSGFEFARDGRTCVEQSVSVDHCRTGSHDCDSTERAQCSFSGGSTYTCSCLRGYHGDGRTCTDIDECEQARRCHGDALCFNTQGSFSCQCRPGYHGDGLTCTHTERVKTHCELQREAATSSSSSSSSSSSGGIFSFFRPRPPAVGVYVPQCDVQGQWDSTQCHTAIGQCWCVDKHGQEVPHTRTGPGSPSPMCIDQAVTPPPVGPTPRPDVYPVAAGTHLLFAQSGKIEQVPLEGSTIRGEQAKPLLHIPDRVVIAVAYDCLHKTVYWTDITGPQIGKARLNGGDIQSVITTDLHSPEGLALDPQSELIFWTDSVKDTVEVSNMDGTKRKVLFNTDLINPRPIVSNPAYGQIYWADWNRDGPKIEGSNMDGSERVVLVKDDLGLPNALTFDLDNQQLCWADAGTHKVECMDPHRRLRRTIIEGIQYPFALASSGRNLYYTDWRREAVVSVDRQSERETEEFLPQKRSRLYGIATATAHCPQVYSYCSEHSCPPFQMCIPKLGGFTCRCPDNLDDDDRRATESNDIIQNGRRCQETQL